jgi:hypothetical protein
VSVVFWDRMVITSDLSGSPDPDPTGFPNLASSDSTARAIRSVIAA